jgi:hypothetical protein
MEKERAVFKPCDYLGAQRPAVNAARVTERDRTVLVDWLYGFIAKFPFDRDTVAAAMGLVDRFLSGTSRRARRALREDTQFQLVAVTALYICLKMHRTHARPALGSASFALLSRRLYTARDIEATEIDILQGLAWRVGRPTSLTVARHVIWVTLSRTRLDARTRARVTRTLLREVERQTEHAVRDYFFATQRPSTTAMAAILNALDRLDPLEHRAVLVALGPVVNAQLAPPEDLVTAKIRLRRFEESKYSSLEPRFAKNSSSDDVVSGIKMELADSSRALDTFKVKREHSTNTSFQGFIVKALKLVFRCNSVRVTTFVERKILQANTEQFHYKPHFEPHFRRNHGYRTGTTHC